MPSRFDTLLCRRSVCGSIRRQAHRLEGFTTLRASRRHTRESARAFQILNLTPSIPAPLSLFEWARRLCLAKSLQISFVFTTLAR
jgi:hypothetical protein